MTTAANTYDWKYIVKSAICIFFMFGFGYCRLSRLWNLSECMFSAFS